MYAHGAVKWLVETREKQRLRPEVCCAPRMLGVGTILEEYFELLFKNDLDYAG